jgi:hypothetical protein
MNDDPLWPQHPELPSISEMIRRDFKVFSLFASWFGPEIRLRNRFITIAIKDSRKTKNWDHP